ncbi:MAG: VIT1/CCC1 transporter family protein, partial [Candidatus Veblenbacteria bacterium]|nr:VIT1/CCC1 transporter family protein [Candidatus Veblenbacteria bacterium]
TESFHRTGVGGYLRDFVYGANDGIITTFAVVAGVAGADLSAKVVIILGFANLFADGFSMAMSNYLGEKSNRDFVATEREREEWEVERLPEEEREEIRKMYRAKGFVGETLELVVATITANKNLWVDEMMVGEHGMVPMNGGNQPWKNAVTTFSAFVLAGFVPLVPYFAGLTARETFPYAIAATAVILFVVGSLRTLITRRRWLVSGLEMLAVGMLAAGVAYAVGAFLSGLV